jgi:hypothetical protein
VGEKLHQGGGGEIPPGPWGKNYTTQETEIRKTDFDPSKFERQSPTVFGASDVETIAAAERLSQEGPSGFQQLKDVVTHLRDQRTEEPRRRRHRSDVPIAANHVGTDTRRRREPVLHTPPGSATAELLEERQIVAAYLADWAAVELGDESPLSSSVTRALRILMRSGLPTERWGDLLYAARATTKEHSAQITKKPSAPGRRSSAKNRMPYFLAVLEQLCGLRPAEPTPSVRSPDSEHPS